MKHFAGNAIVAAHCVGVCIAAIFAFRPLKDAGMALGALLAFVRSENRQ